MIKHKIFYILDKDNYYFSRDDKLSDSLSDLC